MTQEILDPTSNVFDFDAFQKEAAERIKAGEPLMGLDGIFTPLIKKVIDASLEVEMESHIDDCRQAGESTRRNGKTTKTVKSASGSFEVDTPRDRSGSFEPKIVKKRQTILNESLDNKILRMINILCMKRYLIIFQILKVLFHLIVMRFIAKKITRSVIVICKR